MNNSLGNYSVSFQRTQVADPLQSFIKVLLHPSLIPNPSRRCQTPCGEGMGESSEWLAGTDMLREDPVLRELAVS